MDLRLQLQAVKRQEQSRVLFNMLLPMRRVKEAGTKPFFIDFNIYGLPVCANVWCEFLGLTYEDSRMKRLLAALRRGDAEWEGSANSESMQGRRGVCAEAWMRDFVRETAEWNPDKSIASLDPNPVEVQNHPTVATHTHHTHTCPHIHAQVYHMLYVAKWHTRVWCDSGPVDNALEFSQFSKIWRDFKKKPFPHEGHVYAIKERPPKYECLSAVCVFVYYLILTLVLTLNPKP